MSHGSGLLVGMNEPQATTVKPGHPVHLTVVPGMHGSVIHVTGRPRTSADLVSVGTRTAAVITTTILLVMTGLLFVPASTILRSEPAFLQILGVFTVWACLAVCCLWVGVRVHDALAARAVTTDPHVNLSASRVTIPGTPLSRALGTIRVGQHACTGPGWVDELRWFLEDALPHPEVQARDASSILGTVETVIGLHQTIQDTTQTPDRTTTDPHARPELDPVHDRMAEAVQALVGWAEQTPAVTYHLALADQAQ